MSMGKNILINFISALLIVIVLGMGYFVVKQYGFLGEAATLTDSSYQAIFLTNGQVYFGKVADLNNQYVKLNDIYYLILQQPLQPQAEEPVPPPAPVVIKLGDELHGPMDEMFINRDQVLFVEPLKTDSRVVKAIEDFKARGGQ